jgi:hypothetical protein
MILLRIAAALIALWVAAVVVANVPEWLRSRRYSVKRLRAWAQAHGLEDEG